MNDTVATVLVVVFASVGVAFIIFFLVKFQQAIAGKQIDEIELKDASLEKKVNDMSLSDLVNLNNEGKSDKQ